MASTSVTSAIVDRLSRSAVRQHRAGEKIRAFRLARGWTGAEFARRLSAELGEDVSRSAVSNWEVRGKDARPDIRQLLRDWGACDADDWLEPAEGGAGG